MANVAQGAKRNKLGLRNRFCLHRISKTRFFRTIFPGAKSFYFSVSFVKRATCQKFQVRGGVISIAVLGFPASNECKFIS